MSLLAAAILAAAVSSAVPPPASKADVRKKQAAAAAIDARRADLASLADQVWGFAETALRETRSAALLADYAEKQGFRVERGVAGMPTAFVASYGQGRPVIAVLGEYDALPGLSQKAVPERAVLVEGAAGHGCGHNLFGAASLGAAVAVKELIAAGKLGRHRALLRDAGRGGRRRQGLHGPRRALQGRGRRPRLAPVRPHARRHAQRPGARGHDRGVQGAHGPRRLRPLERPQRRGRARALHPRRQHDARAREADRAHPLRDPAGRRRAERRPGPREAVDLGARLRARGGRRRARPAAPDGPGRGAHGRRRGRRSPSRPATTRSW